jgi:hypothetical protein
MGVGRDAGRRFSVSARKLLINPRSSPAMRVRPAFFGIKGNVLRNGQETRIVSCGVTADHSDELLAARHLQTLPRGL